jgi:hypothetical protein
MTKTVAVTQDPRFIQTARDASGGAGTAQARAGLAVRIETAMDTKEFPVHETIPD